MLCLLLAGRVAAQEQARLAREAPLRKAAAGAVLATLAEGGRFTANETRGDWVRLTVEGWIFGRSVGRTAREGHDLVVKPAGGENLRETPNGKIAARLRQGTLLTRLESRGAWVRVRRTGWVPRKAVATPAPAATGPVETAEVTKSPQGAAGGQQAARPVQASAPSKRGAPPPAEEPRVEVAHSAPVYAAPDGPERGTLQPGLGARVLSRTGDWVRVQLEAWVRETDLKPATDGALLGVTAAEIRAKPERYLGQVVEWRLQLIGIQVADELRPELPAGQPFLLTRGPLPEPGFVYVIVPRDRLAQFETLPPLQELVLRVGVKAAHTKYLSTPVVELASVVSGVPAK